MNEFSPLSTLSGVTQHTNFLKYFSPALSYVLYEYVTLKSLCFFWFLTFQSTEASKLWHWIEDSFVPTLQPQYWYGPFIDSHEQDLWSEESVRKKSRSVGGRKLKSKTKGDGSYLDDAVVSFESLKRFPEGFTADRGVFYVVGLARLRQLRMKKGNLSK